MYPKLPSLNSLKVFDAAAKLGSFKRAAEELFITPTAVSHQIKVLEEALNTQLFERKTRAVLLTADGSLLAATTSRIFEQLVATVNEISGSKSTLTVSTTTSFAATWLVPNLEHFYQKNPGIDISIITGEQVVDIERDRRIDIAIRYGKYEPTTKNSTKLTTESVGMYVAPNYLSKIAGINEAQLLEVKWINRSLSSFSWKCLLGDISRKNIIRQFDQEHHVIQAALAGQGIALVSSLLVQNALQNDWLVSYKNSAVKCHFDGFTYYAVIPDRNRNNKNVRIFLDWLIGELSR
ncbi:LysR substrate-binding domain-containing protein [Microbulbifer spongiae]|uniref:LysR substrate-binding domain-containing protein n=1 Tax=Microbulbifer spongiae TaxID=2944933 RepID=A0ABY9E9L1_9GAMM|nr:LysR substrate-binding domain-containing protein [Microbulbifer sp. MI-G]WKD49135.1 LysR substrate-binding domain-containing protein [Microbulbifer sp. MI-G]